MTAPRKTKTNQEPISPAALKESQAGKAASPETFQESQTKRAPVRKYIRKEGIPGHQRITVEVVEQKPREISIASLKEKFGLSESRIGGVIRDAEKLGKIRRSLNGSFVWTQD